MNVFSDKTDFLGKFSGCLSLREHGRFLSGTFEIAGDEETKQKMARGYLIPQYYDSLESYRGKLESAGFRIEEITEYVADFRVQVKNGETLIKSTHP